MFYKKRLAVIFVSLISMLGVATLVYAATGIAHAPRVDVDGWNSENRVVLMPMIAGDGVGMENPHWMGEGKNYWFSAEGAALESEDEWREFKFSFMPGEDGEAKLWLKSSAVQNPDGGASKIANWVEYRNVRIASRAFADIVSNRKGTGWFFADRSQVLSDGFVVWHDQPVYCRLKLKRGEPVIFTAEVRKARR